MFICPRNKKSHRKFEKCWNFLNCFYNRVFFQGWKSLKTVAFAFIFKIYQGIYESCTFLGPLHIVLPAKRNCFYPSLKFNEGVAQTLRCHESLLDTGQKNSLCCGLKSCKKSKKNLGHREANRRDNVDSTHCSHKSWKSAKYRKV